MIKKITSYIIFFSFFTFSLLSIELQKELNTLKDSLDILQKKLTKAPIIPELTPPTISTQPKKPLNPPGKMPKVIYYSRLSSSWGALDYTPNVIVDFAKRLGVTLIRKEPDDPELINDKNALFFVIAPGRPGGSEGSNYFTKLASSLRDKGHHLMISLHYAPRATTGFRTIKTRMVNGVSIFYFEYDNNGIIETDIYQEEMSELKNALSHFNT